MSAGKIIAYILAGIIIIFGFLFMWGAFSPEGQVSWLYIGGITILVGFGIIYAASRMGSKTASDSSQQQTTLKIDLPSDVNIERFQCQDCGAQLSMENVKMVAGAPMVDCPYCGAAYQLTEDPKW
ncbi:MAG: hypothetical protein PVF83_16195 [Anaerolineales bacterium]|jgi:hypothetical protein